jgi:predicted AAA+ superfamily ATPase
VRQVTNIGDLVAFTQFVRLCAGRTATTINLSSLGSDAGVSHNTARSWLSVLETGFLCFRAPAWRTNVRKQETKAPKMHFIDSGLVCNLLGIREPQQLRLHPLRGQIFESWVASEIFKARAHRGGDPRLFHYRDARGLEIDVVVDTGSRRIAVEAKSGATVPVEALRPLERFGPDDPSVSRLVVAGAEEGRRHRTANVLSWRKIQDVDWAK